jgi:hypothetical protein
MAISSRAFLPQACFQTRVRFLKVDEHSERKAPSEAARTAWKMHNVNMLRKIWQCVTRHAQHGMSGPLAALNGFSFATTLKP